MKISIITVCLNAENTIEDTFLSIFNQTYKNIEFIVIDGKSTDKTFKIIEKYKDKIHYFVSEPDNGIYDAMNKGIQKSTGDFIIFLNANDVFYDNLVLEKVANKLIENPEMKFLFGDVELIYKNGQENRIKSFNNIKNCFSLMCDNICHQSIFYHKSLFEKYGLYSLEYKIYSDWEFNIKCLVKNKVKAIHLPIIVSKFNLEGVSTLQDNPDTVGLERKKILTKYYPIFKFVLFANNYFKKKFNFYKQLIQNPLFVNLINLFCSQKIYQLRISECDSI